MRRGSSTKPRRRCGWRSIGGDYVLLLGALLVSADLGYAESEFHWLGLQWSWYLLVLAVSVAALAGWFGVEGHIGTVFALDGSMRESGVQSLLCAAVIVAWREAQRRLGGSPGFDVVFDHFAANIGFWGALSLSFQRESRWAGAAMLVAAAVVSIRKGLRGGQEIFVVYGVCYTALGLCILEAQVFQGGLLIALIELATVIIGVIVLWYFHQKMRAAQA